MNPSLNISVFGLSLSAINDLKQALTIVLAAKFQINWTHIADKNLQILFVHERFSDLAQIERHRHNSLHVLKLGQNEQAAGKIVNNILYLPLYSTHALTEWLSQSLSTELSMDIEPKPAFVAKVSMLQQQLSHQSIRSAFNSIYSEYANISKFLIQSQGQTLSFFDVNSKELYSNTELNIHTMSELEIIPADLNSIVHLRKKFRARDLNHGIWQFVWDNLAEDVPEYHQAYRLRIWPQPMQHQQRNLVLKISAYLSKGCTAQYIQEKMQLSPETVYRYLFACEIAQMLEEIPLEQALQSHPMLLETTPVAESSVRGFFSKLRKKLGL